MNNQVRTLFYGVIGAYLVYLAYDLFPARTAMEESSANWMLACCILFAAAGVIYIFLALRLFKKVFIDKDENFIEQEVQEEKEEGKEE